MKETNTESLWTSKRYLVVFLTFVGYLNHSARVNISVAVVAMMNNVTSSDGEIIHEGFLWTQQEKGLILSSFFYGYLATQLLGGWLAAKVGGSTVFGAGIAITSIAALLNPLIVNSMGVPGMVFIRIIQGIAAGVAFPCCNAIFSKWAPVNERSRMTSIAISGQYFGTVFANLFSGLLAVKFGWASIFYVFGGAGIVWCIVWTLLVGNSPETDRYISEEEKKYIMVNRGESDKKLNIPWKKIFTSVPVIAITVAHFAFDWGFFTLFNDLPSYIKNTLHADLEETGYISALPYITVGTLQAFTGVLADWLKVKEILNLTQIRKYFTSFSFVIQAGFLCALGYTTNFVLCIVLVVFCITIGAFSSTGFMVNSLDIAPQYASIILGISNTIATIPGILSPLLTGFIVNNHTFEEWRTVFFVSAAMYVIGALFYWMFSSGEIQPWANQNSTDNSKPENKDVELNNNLPGSVETITSRL